MIFHENRLLACDSHEIAYLFFSKLERMSQNLSSAAVVIGAIRVNLFHSGYLQTSSLANSEDPDVMPHDAVFHQRQHYLLSQKNIQRKKYNYTDGL